VPPARPLCVTADPDLLEVVFNIAVDLGIDLEVTTDPAEVRRWYDDAPFVVIGDGSAAVCVKAELPHRPGVFLVTRDPDVNHLRAVGRLLGVERVVPLPPNSGSFQLRLAQLTEESTRQAYLIAVIGGRGGAGTSVFAAALAVTGARAGLRALLVDADPLGGGVDLVVGWEDLNGLRWPMPADVAQQDGSRGDLAVLSSARTGFAGWTADEMASVIEDGRESRDLIVADLPRRIDDAGCLLLNAADRVFLLVPSELRAVAAAARVAAVASTHTEQLELVVREPGPGRLRPREIAKALDLPMAGVLKPEPGLSRALDRGSPPAGNGRGPLAALCRRLIGEIPGGDSLTAGALA
jgi:secretion/DNA translocation related CpaE-like protein